MSAYESERSPLAPPRDVLPPSHLQSQYLQDKLNERRARHSRPKRARHTDFGPQRGRDDDIFLNEAEAPRNPNMYESSPLGASTRSDASGTSRRRALGIRDMDHQMDRLTKQNFALKLELDHRREHTIKLNEEIEAMREQCAHYEQMEREHKELIAINTQLVEEMEKRDKAVEEAMDIICDLEEKVAYLEDRSSNTRPSTANADSGYAGTENLEQDHASSPPNVALPPKTPRVHVRPPSQHASAASQKLQGLLDGQTPAKPRREPNILSQKKPSTQALRSVYLENAQQLHPVKSFHSLLSRQDTIKPDDETDDVLNSPRLSVLSESSFPSMYTPQKITSPERFPWEEDEDEDGTADGVRPRAHLRQDSINRVSQWITAERDAAENTPSKSNSISTPLAERGMSPKLPKRGISPTHYQSLNDALVSATAKSPELLQSSTSQQMEAFARRKYRPPPEHLRPTSFGGPIFGEPLLPPTPDSASTRMLRSSRSSIADDRSLLDTTPAVVRGYDPLLKPPKPPTEIGVRTAPRQMRSSVELRTAFASNMEFRSLALDDLRHVESSDEDTVQEFGMSDDDQFPDGKSILMGTPRRLLKPSKPPMAGMRYDGEDFAPQLSQPSPRRRQSSDEFMRNPAKPRLGRVETSPTVFSSLSKVVNSGGKTSVESVTSPRSAHSGSSGGRTIVQIDEEVQALPEVPSAHAHFSSSVASPTRSRTSPSPARMLGQKTAILLRRLSNSHGSDREKPTSPTMFSPASPTLSNAKPAEIKRPRTSQGHSRPTSSGQQRPSSSRDTNRPTLQSRTKTEPPTARPPSSGSNTKNFFRRSNSHKTSESTADANARNGQPKRRGSLRDAVTGTNRRPWR